MKDILKETLRSFSRHGGTLLSGAIAFYAVLSAAPLFVIALAVAGSLTGQAAARAELLRGLSAWAGEESAATIARILEGARASGSGTAAGALSGLVLAYGSTRLFSQLRRALNHMWDVEARPARDFKDRAWKQLEKRLLSFAMVLFCGVFLLASVLARAVLTAASEAAEIGFAGVPDRWHLLDHVLSLPVVTVLFAVLFKILPDVKIAWRDAWAGALVTALLFSVGRTVVGIYLGHKSLSTTFGAAGSLVLLLLWTHYSAQIFFLGAAFTAVRARRAGRAIAPSDRAIPVGAAGDAYP